MNKIEQIYKLEKSLTTLLMSNNINSHQYDRSSISYLLDIDYHKNKKIASAYEKISNIISSDQKDFYNLNNEKDILERHINSFLMFVEVDNKSFKNGLIRDISDTIKLHTSKYSKLDFINKYLDKLVGKTLIEEVILMENSDQSAESIKELFNAFYKIVNVFKKELIENIPPLKIIIKDDEECSYAMPENNLIMLRGDKDSRHLLSELLHEFIHVIEYFNDELRLKSYEFLLNRSKLYGPMDKLSERFKKPNPANIKSPVHLGQFQDLYAGFVYDIDGVAMTEFLSTNFQYFFINPVTFSYKDPEIVEYMKENLFI